MERKMEKNERSQVKYSKRLYYDTINFSTSSAHTTINNRGVDNINWRIMFKSSSMPSYDVSKLAIYKKNNPPVKPTRVIGGSATITHIPFSRRSRNNFLDETWIQLDESSVNECWRKVGRIRCVDRDEGTMTARAIRMTPHDAEIVKGWLYHECFPRLMQALEDQPIAFKDNSAVMRDFMSHIIFKGKEFYDCVIAHPSLCLYLCGNTYPIWTWLFSL